MVLTRSKMRLKGKSPSLRPLLSYTVRLSINVLGSTKHAPWYVIPSNHKWFRNLAVSQIIADTLVEMHPYWPKPTVDLDEIRRLYHGAAGA